MVFISISEIQTADINPGHSECPLVGCPSGSVRVPCGENDTSISCHTASQMFSRCPDEKGQSEEIHHSERELHNSCEYWELLLTFPNKFFLLKCHDWDLVLGDHHLTIQQHRQWPRQLLYPQTQPLIGYVVTSLQVTFKHSLALSSEKWARRLKGQWEFALSLPGTSFEIRHPDK